MIPAQPPLAGLQIAVIGGGINGVMAAWALVDRGAKVTLFERDDLMSHTSQASTKMLHGGLRYLANFELRMVRASLQERQWWLSKSTGLVRQLPIAIPIKRHDLKSRAVIGLGVKLYDQLAAGSGFARSRWLSLAELEARFPDLRTDSLCGAWEYWDAQMDDYALGCWAAQQVQAAGVVIREQTPVQRITANGMLSNGPDPGQTQCFDLIVNACGPWAQALLDQSEIPHRYGLTLIRGSHLLLSNMPQSGLALPHQDQRLIFFLPYQSQGLLGTTESSQTLDEPIRASQTELEELKACYNKWFKQPLHDNSIQRVFSGVRPVVRQIGKSLSKASREAVIESHGCVITVWGGKWTSARQLGLEVAQACAQKASC